MAYHNWMTGIYSEYDGIFNHYEHEAEIAWLKSQLPKEALYNEDGEYKFRPKDTYEGYHRKHTTGYHEPKVKNEEESRATGHKGDIDNRVRTEGCSAELRDVGQVEGD